MTRVQLLSQVRTSLTALVFLFLTGCASTSEFADPRDPWEGFNRAMYSFNEAIDNALVKPLAKGYKAVVPVPVDRGITNFFSNLGDIGSAINNLLQFKLSRAGSDLGRVAFNTTLGLLGFFDVATNMNLPRYGEDFGQTLGVWGSSPGPYIVLPLLGPSSGRDAIGLVVDWFTDPVSYIEDDSVRIGLQSLWFVDRRADLLSASKLVEQAALDPYEFVRNAYLQKRRHDVFDGNPPPEPDDEEPEKPE
ncbi:MAG: VacJ family lipoprotein [Gammaproteobacteria bacterium]|nr:VacJ family lipoprotein [Gammaproteobacteria bacterium]